MKAVFKVIVVLWSLTLALSACRVRITPLPPPSDPPKTEAVCQAPAIEKNIVGTWRFESNRFPAGVIRTGSVTFTIQNRIIDPDSLFENHLDAGFGVFKVVDKIYTTDGTYPSSFIGYTGKIFRVDLLIRNNETGTVWPLYVASNECNKIVIYQLGSYDQSVPKKYGFTLTR